MHLRCLAPLLFCALLPLRGEDAPPFSPEELSGALRRSGLPAGAAEGGVSLPLESSLSGWTVAAQIDGKPVRLLLDLGASCILLAPETARKLGLRAQGKSESFSTGDGGRLASQRALSKRIDLGSAWTENEPVFIADMIGGLAGLLGVSTLADWDVRIDPSAQKLTLFPKNEAPPLEGETVLPLTCKLTPAAAKTSNPQGFRSLSLTLPVRVGTHDLPVIPDTGYGGILELPSTLAEKAAPEALKDAHPGLVTGVSLSGQSMTREMKLPEFTFGNDTLRNLSAGVFTASRHSISESEGIIGVNLLRHYVMTFRFSAGELRLKPLGTVQEITQSSTAGINMDREYKILSVVPAGPADKAGLRAGDEVLEIEGHPLKTMKPEEFAAFKRLPPGSVVKVRYQRGELGPVEASLVLVKK